MATIAVLLDAAAYHTAVRPAKESRSLGIVFIGICQLTRIPGDLYRYAPDDTFIQGKGVAAQDILSQVERPVVRLGAEHRNRVELGRAGLE